MIFPRIYADWEHRPTPESDFTEGNQENAWLRIGDRKRGPGVNSTAPSRPTALRSWSAQEAEFSFQALDFAPQAADQPECPAVYAMMPAVMLETTQLVKGVVVENQVGFRARPRVAEKTKLAIIPEHFRMHAAQAGGGFERISRGLRLGHADQHQGIIVGEDGLTQDRKSVV